MRKLLGSALLLAAVALMPATSAAQRRAAARPAPARAQKPSFGVELDWGSNNVDVGIGARGVFPLESLFPRTPLDGILSFDYFFPSHPSGTSATYWEINGDVAYRLTVPAQSSFRPYVGGGLGIDHASATVGTASASDTKAALNLLGGTTFKVKGTMIPFIEVRGEIGGGKNVVLTGGIRF
ncbi:MAG TPA: hypothetical protein VH137_03545 [Gemmatimonadales bacterium]|nr:hypothetical protein [Gemmatimonadales bacterium]